MIELFHKVIMLLSFLLDICIHHTIQVTLRARIRQIPQLISNYLAGATLSLIICTILSNLIEKDVLSVALDG